MSPDPEVLARALAAITPRLGQNLHIVGLCGAQGSGKSTLAAALAAHFSASGTPTAVLSLDDLYLPRTTRLAMARDIHPLFATRGPPGTHDIPLGLATLDALSRGEPAPLPRFSKATDDRIDPAQWPKAPAQTRLLIFEGWCIGARAQSEAALAAPINPLESNEDPAGIWRHAVNRALAADYPALFQRINQLILLAAPEFGIVHRWRDQQEAPLRADGQGMSSAQIARFIQHYERLTRHILAEMPSRADLTIPLDEDRKPRESTPPPHR